MDGECTCIRCAKVMPNLAERGLQPIGGLAFATGGHYGSEFFDPMDGSQIEIVVCDECLEELDAIGIIGMDDP